jgi:hypothetical protein
MEKALLKGEGRIPLFQGFWASNSLSGEPSAGSQFQQASFRLEHVSFFLFPLRPLPPATHRTWRIGNTSGGEGGAEG